MSATDSLSDYFNNFNASKGYRKLAFIAGRPLQSAELNEQQDIILDLLGKVGKYLVSNGTILSGGEVTRLTSTSISINEASVQIEGVPTEVAAGSLTLPSGTSIVGVAVTESLITGLQDSALLEPDSQSPNYQGYGADRVKIAGVWKLSTSVLSTETFFPVLTITDGVIVASSSSTTSSDAIDKAISVYDKGVHGSYVLNGLTLAYSGTDATSGDIQVSMSSGTARVAGNESTFTLESLINLDPVSDVKSVSSEPIVFSTGTTSYTLRNTPVSEITSVSGTKTVTATVTRGASSGGMDYLPNTPVLSIVSIVQGATTYISGTDFKQSGDYVDWSLTGAEPSPGSTYTVVFRYIATFSATTDGTNLVLNSLDASLLVNASTLYVDYNFYLTRIDRVLLDSTGTIKIQKGTPNLPASAQVPAKPSGGFLSLGTVTMAHGADAVIDQDSTVYMVPFSTMKAWSDRLDSIEYNVAQLALKDTASSSDPTSTKRGVIVDSLGNENMRDSGVTQNAVIVDSQLKIPSNLTTSARYTGKLHLDIASESELISQPYFTKSQKINPYAGSGSVLQADISLAPSVLYGNTWWWWWHGNVMPRASTVTVMLGRFTAGEVIDVYFRGTINGQCTAASDGTATYNLTVPANTAYGSYQIVATGRTSHATTSAAVTCRRSSSDYYGDFSWTGGEVPYGYDPVAQTFTMTKSADVSAVSVILTEVPTNTLFIKIVPVVVGIPDSSTILGYGSIAPSACVNGWNKVSLKMPVSLDSGTDYAIIVSTANYAGSVGTAKVGSYDSTNNVWITKQAATGVLLTSANEKTWTPVQDEDLAFKIHTATYSSSKTLKLLSMSNAVNNCTDLKLSSLMEVPAGTTAKFYIRVGTTHYDLAINDITAVSAIPNSSGNLDLYAVLTTSDTSKSPMILEGTDLLTGVLDTPATYVQRSFTVPNGSTTAATYTVILDQYAPTGSTIVPAYLDGNGNWITIPQTSSMALGDGWYTVTYKVTGIKLNSSKLKLTLSSDSYSARPLVENIRLLVV